MRVLFIEPPKRFWFLMGEYLPPPLGILQLAAYLEREVNGVEIEVVDCQAESMDWVDLENRIRHFDPDIVASSGLATCNAYVVARTLALAKHVKPNTVTVAGGQHFTSMAQESLEQYPEIDVVVRGEGEQSFTNLVLALARGTHLLDVEGISFRREEEVVHTAAQPVISDLDTLPFPGYHYVRHVMNQYHFSMMAGRNTVYSIIEGSRGCSHRCTFCTQWRHWGGTYRSKSPARIADEMERLFREYNSRFIWLADDNFMLGERASRLCDEILQRGLADEIRWFVQARCDDVVENRELLPKMRRAGLRWMLLGAESHDGATLQSFNKRIEPGQTRSAVRLLKENDIFSQLTFIIGNREDSTESIESLRRFADSVDPDLAIFMVLTPFPGTDIYKTAKENGWIEDPNWANYDMIHPIMATEKLSRAELYEELYKCYRGFYGSWRRRLTGIISSNQLKRRTYRYMANRALLGQLRSLF